ncbi:MAG: DNA repair protein RecN, partial [Nitrospinota bacterium]
EVVGRRLRAIAASHQVICITHLPQIASLASSHYLIRKRTLRGRTETAIERLELEGRVEELARMAAGREVTETARRHARELLGLKS